MESLAEYSRHILHSFRAPFALDRSLVYITASIGIAVYPDHARSADELIKYSDVAMYRSKDRGGNCSTIFDGAMIHDVSDRLEIEHRLRTALSNNELRYSINQKSPYLLIKSPVLRLCPMEQSGIG